MKVINKIIMLNLFILFSNSFSQDEDTNNQFASFFHHDAFNVNILVQTGLRYSMENSDFQGGRTFEAINARLSLRGKLKSDFFYRVFFNFVNEPNILDAYIGYNYSNSLRLTAGLMKPKQTLDYIPDPGSTDFIDRTKITGLLVQSREIGLAFDGDIDGFHYWMGLFNGNKKFNNNNNEFYGIGRVQYTMKNILFGKIILAFQSSHGNSQDVTSGSNGPKLRGKRTIYGTDVRIESGGFLLSAEYLAGDLETVDIIDKKT